MYNTYRGEKDTDKKQILPSGVLFEGFKGFSWFSFVLSNSFIKFLLIGASPKKKLPYMFLKHIISIIFKSLQSIFKN